MCLCVSEFANAAEWRVRSPSQCQRIFLEIDAAVFSIMNINIMRCCERTFKVLTLERYCRDGANWCTAATIAETNLYGSQNEQTAKDVLFMSPDERSFFGYPHYAE